MPESVEKIWVSVLFGGVLLLIVLVYLDLTRVDQAVTRLPSDSVTQSVTQEVTRTTSPVQTPKAVSPVQQLHALINGQQVEQLTSLVASIDADTLNEVHQGFTAVMRASSVGNIDVLAMLLAAGGDPSVRGSSERTALQYAVEKNRVDAAKMLIEAGVDIDGVDETRLSPLVMAIDRGYTDLAYYLLEQGADTNIQHIAGFTALIDAARNGDMALVQALIEAGADPAIALPDGRTAADLAQQLEHYEVAVYLKALE